MQTEMAANAASDSEKALTDGLLSELERISKAALPLIFASLLALVVIIIFPDLSTFVPRMLGQM